MAVQGVTITLTTNPTIIGGSFTPPSVWHGNMRLTVVNRGAATVYLGDGAVTTGGFALSTADTPAQFILGQRDTLYGTSTGSIVINVLRSGETT